jgi:hypothetical protein
VVIFQGAVVTFVRHPGSIAFSALVIFTLAFVDDSTAAPIKPEKEKGDEYSNKLIGVWEGMEVRNNEQVSFTIEFKAGGGLKFELPGGHELVGTWNRTKEEGKTVTIDAEVSLPEDGNGISGVHKVTFLVAFENAHEVAISAVGDKSDPKKLKRRP